MKSNRLKPLGVTVLVVAIATLAFISCSQGVPVEDAREMQEEIRSISSRVTQIEGALLDLKEEDIRTGDAETQIVIDDLISELRDVSVRMAEIEAKLDFPEPEQQTDAGLDPGMGGGAPGSNF